MSPLSFTRAAGGATFVRSGCLVVVSVLGIGAGVPLGADELGNALVFHASYDDSEDADVAGGDGQIYTAAKLDLKNVRPGLPANVSRQTEGGKWGGFLKFADVSDEVVFYKGRGNLPYSSDPYDGTICLWLRVDPHDGLKPGYVDPIQITDKKWNDASIFLDFTKANPREFRLGLFSDLTFWNPDGNDFDKLPESERPMVVWKQPTFSADHWTHVTLRLKGINGDASVASLLIDGRSVGDLKRDQRLTWDMEKVAIMLGIQYVGGIDDLAIFDRALSYSEIDAVMSRGVAEVASLSKTELADTGGNRSDTLVRTEPPSARIDGRGQGWQSLGQSDFVNVNCDDDTWTWKDGHAYCTGKPVGVIRSRMPIENFELVCEWKHKQKGGNSGVFVWASQDSIDELAGGKGRLPHGIEVQVLDLGYKELYEQGGKRKADWFTSHGDVFPTGPATMKPFPPVAPNGKRSFPSKELTKGLNEWNHYYIRAIHGEVRLWVNGEEVSGGTACQPSNGYLCLESEGAPVEFRNIKIRRLP